MPTEVLRRPEEVIDRPEDRTQRDIEAIERSRMITFYQKNILKDSQPLDIEGYASPQWDTENVLIFEKYVFIASVDGRIAGFESIGIDEYGEQFSALSMRQFPVISSVLREKFGFQPVEPMQRSEQARKAEVARQPEARLDGSSENLLSALQQQISIESSGEPLTILWPTAATLSHYLRTNGVPKTRYEQYVKNIKDHAELLRASLRVSKFRGNVTFDGQHFIATDGKTLLMTTATRVLKKRSPSNTFTLLDGKEPVSIRENATTTEYRVSGRRELHRRDGGLQLLEQGSTLSYYDGSNRTPLIEKRGDDIVIGPNAAVGISPKGDSLAYAREIVRRLRTPEAIGAYVSQFYHGQDFSGPTPEHRAWLQSIQKGGDKPAQYVADIGNQTQTWQKTLERGAGDCEDFALLAQGLLELAGINSFTMMVSPVHYETVYFEPAAGGNFYVCTVGLRGFHRSRQTFSSHGQAVASLWEGTGSGAQVALRNPAVRAQFANPRDANRYPENAPGIFQLRQPGDQDGNSDMIEYSDEAYFAQYV